MQDLQCRNDFACVKVQLLSSLPQLQFFITSSPILLLFSPLLMLSSSSFLVFIFLRLIFPLLKVLLFISFPSFLPLACLLFSILELALHDIED